MQMRHKKTGHLYKIVALGVQEDTREPVVCYQGMDGMMWVRPAAKFFDGRFEVEPAGAPCTQLAPERLI